jgi:hypothetical protein
MLLLCEVRHHVTYTMIDSMLTNLQEIQQEHRLQRLQSLPQCA